VDKILVNQADVYLLTLGIENILVKIVLEIDFF